VAKNGEKQAESGKNKHFSQKTVFEKGKKSAEIQ
jgi:hypothetical protein